MGKIKNISGDELTVYARASVGSDVYNKTLADNEEDTVSDLILATSPQMISAIERGLLEVTEGAASVKDAGIKGSVSVFSALPVTAGEGDIYIVEADEGANPNGFYMMESAAWVLKSEISLQDASEVTNDSAMAGATVKDALDNVATHTSGDGSDHANVAVNDAHVAGDGSDHANVAVNDTHVAGNGADHANVAVNDAHVAGNGADHANVATNDAHVAGDGSDHANVALNDTHRASDGTDHANVVVNDAHVAGDGSDHANVAVNDAHVAGAGADHADVATNSAHVALVAGNPHVVTGLEATYVPAVTGDWSSSNPATVAAALDRLAAALGPIA